MRPVFAAWAVLATCVSVPSTGAAGEPAGDQATLEREFRAEHEVDLRFHNPGLAGVVGRALPPEDRGDAAAQIGGFFSGYPRGFVARYVREVIVLDDLVVDNIRARGHRNERRMLLELKGPGHELSKRDFDHELFHALDGYLRDWGVRLPDAA